MGKLIMTTLKGAVIGAISAVCLFFIGFLIEMCNFAGALLSCDWDREAAFKWSGMWGLLLLFILGGAAIGLFYGIYKAKEESKGEAAKRDKANAEEARKQRVKWASDVKQKALNINNICSKNKSSDKPLVETTYKADAQMGDIISELTKVAELRGKIDFLAEDLANKS